MSTERVSENAGKRGAGREESVFVPGAGSALSRTAPIPKVKAETPRQYLDRLLTDLNQPSQRWKTPAWESLLASLDGSQGAEIAKRVSTLSRSYQEYLRDLVDMWINTGKNVAAGTDQPSSRKPNAKIHDVIERVFATQYAVALPVGDGYALTIARGALQLDGDRGEGAAELLFAELLISPWRLMVARCAKCDRYFKLKHWERTYFSGTICEPCTPRRRSERSARCKKVARAQADSKLYQAAAQHFRRHIAGRPGWRDNTAFKNKVAAFLTARIAQSEELQKEHRSGKVTAKWLAHHKNWSGIEKAVQANA